jgi:hypothetical protein
MGALICELLAARADHSLSGPNPIEISTRTPNDACVRVPWQREEKE